MSFEGQVLCQRKEVGPCALTIAGKPRLAAPVAAAAAPVRNLRRAVVCVCCSLMEMSPLFGLSVLCAGSPTCIGMRKARRFYSRRFETGNAGLRPWLRLVRRVGVPADQRVHEEEADHVRERDVPAVPEPQADRA